MGCGQSSINTNLISKPTQPYQYIQTSDFEKLTSNEMQKTFTNADDNKSSSRTTVAQDRRKSKLSEQEISQLFEKVNKDPQRLFQQISQRVSEYYMQLSVEVIELMNQKKFSQVETKVHLSEKFLLQSLDILKIIGEKTKFEYQLQVFKWFNKSQGSLISYLKEKYPRAGNVFVPGDLMQIFKEFNMVQSPENDILRNAGVCFSSPDTAQIVNKLKQFFNMVIEETDAKFPIFQNLLQEEVFHYEFEGKKKILNYKIGRKLPENTSKYQEEETDDLSINSPELFRMIIKWLIDMEEYFNQTSDEINQKENFKVYNINKKGEVNFDDISPDEFDQLNQILKQKFKQIKQPFNMKLSSLLKEMDMFNANLLRILFTTERKQKYVPKNQAIVIKFAMYNTKLVSWLVSEKLVTILQNLIKIGISFEKENIFKRIDLIKFNVKDLLRAMIIGNKKQILAVYKNIKKLEQQGKMKVIQIRNRLGTPLNDAMIIFTMKQSFLICELQLILSEGQGVSDKGKNIQLMNHFLYELERSPYGILSEVAVLLGYKDNKINYEEKITFTNKQFSGFNFCEESHPESVLIQKIQKKPFICSQCTQFYHPYQNIFGMKRCNKCFIFQCCKCLFKNNPQLEEYQINHRFSEELACIISNDRSRKSFFTGLTKDITIEAIQKLFYQKKFFFKDIFNKNLQKLKPKDLHQFIKNKRLNYDNDQYSNWGIGQPCFLLVQFKGEITSIECYFWNQKLGEIEHSFSPSCNFYTQQKISSSYYDFIILFQSQTFRLQPPSFIQKQLKVCIDPTIQYQSVRKVGFLNIEIKKLETKAVLIIRVQLSRGQNENQQDEQMSLKKDFPYSSIFEARKSLPSLGIVQQNFQLKNYGVTTALLNEYFEKAPQKNRIKSINLSNNKLTDVSIILNECLEVQNLVLSKNFIKTIKIAKPLKKIQKLILCQNRISEASGFKMAPLLKKLNLQGNKLKQLEVLNMDNLEELIISSNQFLSLSWLQKSKLKSLQILTIEQCGIMSEGIPNKGYVFDFEKLKKFNYTSNPTKEITLKSAQLKYLNCQSCSLQKINFHHQSIEYLKLQSNGLTNLEEILTLKSENLKFLYVGGAGSLKKLPLIQSETLQILDLSSCSLSDVQNLSEMNALNLLELNLSSNQIKRFPFISQSLRNLKNLNLMGLNFTNIEQISNCTLPSIEVLQLSGEYENKLDTCPSFNLQSLTKLTLTSFNFVQMRGFSSSNLPKLQLLNLLSCNIEEFPQIGFESLEELNLNSLKTNTFKFFNQTKFKNLKNLSCSIVNSISGQELKIEDQMSNIESLKLTKLDIYYSQFSISIQKMLSCCLQKLTSFSASSTVIKYLPILKLPLIQTFQITGSLLENVDNLQFSSLGQIQFLNLSSNCIERMPKVSLAKVKRINLSYNKLKNLEQFQKSQLSQIEELCLSNNELVQFPNLGFSKLKSIQIQNNPLKSISHINNKNLKNLQSILINNCQLTDTSLPVLDFPKMTYLLISECNITNLGNLSKSILPRLETLNLINLNIIELPLIKFPKLSTVSIQSPYQYQIQESTRVKIKKAQNMSRWDCPQLISIEINNTEIQRIPTLNFPKLQTLNLSANKLQSLSLKNSNLPELDNLFVESNPELNQVILPNGCYLSSVKISSTKVQYLKYFENIRIQTLEINQTKLKSLQGINFRDILCLYAYENQIEQISSYIKQAPKLMSLTIYNNKIKVFPDVPFLSLIELQASGNQLTEFCIKKQNIPSMQRLYLNNNKINKITYLSCRIQTIDLSENKLTEINFLGDEEPTTYSSFSANSNCIEKIKFIGNFYSIYLQNNKIKNLDWVPECKHDNWTNISLSYNEIGDASGLFNHKKVRAKNLQSVSLNDNVIKKVLITNQFPMLISLNLTNNQIIEVRGLETKILPCISSLILVNNKIESLENVELKELYSLDLSYNQIKELKSLKCPNLYDLSLDNNKIASFEWIFKLECPVLSNLRLVNNQISTVPKLSKQVKISSLYLQGNQIQNFAGFLDQKMESILSLSFTIKESLPLEQKKQIKQKMLQMYGGSTCSNPQLQENNNQQNDIQNQQNVTQKKVLGTIES